VLRFFIARWCDYVIFVKKQPSGMFNRSIILAKRNTLQLQELTNHLK
jgi:hypothetical protein